ncbi:hypothetical protein [Spirosoma jeollabukense]
MSTGQNYSGKGDHATQPNENGSNLGSMAGNTVSTAANPSRRLSEGDSQLNLSLGLYHSERDLSEVTSLYWVLEDAIHEAICKVGNESTEEDERAVLHDDIGRYQDIQNKLFGQLHKSATHLLKKLEQASTGQNAADQALQIKAGHQERKIAELEKELALYRQIITKTMNLDLKGGEAL